MEEIKASQLKTILHSKRANLYYLEYCRILVNGGRVEYLTEAGKKQLYWNIPIANTTVILLGTGTSITQAAVRELAKAGVMIGFCGGQGSPLFAGVEAEIDIEWLNPQSEYRPVEYLQQWLRFWFDDRKRLEAGRYLQLKRLQQISQHWPKQNDFPFDQQQLQSILNEYQKKIKQAQDHQSLLLIEAHLTKQLYRLSARAVNYGSFKRAKRGRGIDPANRFLDHGNYLAYGLAAVATWVMGLPHAFAVLHGKTRRGGLVFDLADLIKDAVVLPLAFTAAMNGYQEQEFRQQCIQALTHAGALDLMMDTIKQINAKLT